jgi:hypothetical protein
MESKKETADQQHCPACNRYVRYSSRYPQYACDKCMHKAVDQDGRRIAFYNTTFDGHGCQGFLFDSNVATDSSECFIKGIRFKAEEAYMGGVVLLPEAKRSRSRKRST